MSYTHWLHIKPAARKTVEVCDTEGNSCIVAKVMFGFQNAQIVASNREDEVVIAPRNKKLDFKLTVTDGIASVEIVNLRKLYVES